MRILITSPSLDTDRNISGISSVTRFIIESDIRNEYQHFILGKGDAETRGIPWLLKIIKAYVDWTWLMISGKDILIHFNLALSKPSIIRDSPLILISRLFRKRIVVHLHGGDFLMHRSQPQWMKFLLKLNFSGNIPKIVLSPVEKEMLKKTLHTDKIHILPNCIGLDEAKSFERSYRRHGFLRVLFLGRISSDKGMEYIFRAMQFLRNKSIKLKFYMAGAGPDETEYKGKFLRLMGEDFEFMGVVKDERKSELLRKCDVFLLPSFYEGLPMALVESMAFGLVPVTTGVGSIRYVIKDGMNGIIVDSHSSAGISSALETLANDKEYMKKLSKNAREYILTNFNPDLYVARLNEIYSSI
jgi:glycosyltransferase involved in cell wall biosynthesis